MTGLLTSLIGDVGGGGPEEESLLWTLILPSLSDRNVGWQHCLVVLTDFYLPSSLTVTVRFCHFEDLRLDLKYCCNYYQIKLKLIAIGL